MGRQLALFGNISYTYNEDGIRTSKTSNGVTTKFYLDGTRIVEQTDGTTILHFFYDSNSEVIGFRYNENDYFYVKNSMGDIVGVADVNGNLIVSYTYDAWGKVTSVTGSNTELGNLNPFRYRSYYYDTETELYYLQSRYYDPEIGRFINCDDVNYIGITELELSYNPFAYCENNPVNGWDPSGAFFEKIMSLLRVYNKITNKAKEELSKCIIIVRDNRTYETKDEYGNDKKIKIKHKYQIKVNFADNREFWVNIYNSEKRKEYFDFLAKSALQKFKGQIEREFLLDEECVDDELYVHLQGYLWSINKSSYCPIRFYGFCLLEGYFSPQKIRSKVHEASYEANIYEADMFRNKHEAAIYGFNYFSHIQDCYIDTKKDPYYDLTSKTRSRFTLREEWLSEKL